MLPSASVSGTIPLPFLDEDPSGLYKIYVGFERDYQKKISHLDVIDGWLRNNECLVFKYRKNLENSVSYFEFEVIPCEKANTYIRIPVDIKLLNTVLVKVFRENKCIGYQWSDLEGNVLTLPKREPLKKESARANS